jgi:hypothetical protein
VTPVPGIAPFLDRADATPEPVYRPTPLRMEIGDLVTYQGRQYVLRGLDPMSVDERRAELEDLANGEHVWVLLSDLEEPPDSAA